MSAADSDRPVAILGGGGHARVVIETLRLAGAQVLGVIDSNPAVAERLPAKVKYLGARLDSMRPSDCDVAIGVGSIDVGEANPRPRLFDQAKAAGFAVRSLCHPAAVLATDAVLGEGSQVMAGAILQPGVVLGVNCLVNTGASLDHDCRIAGHVHIAPGAVLSGGITVGEGVHIGTGAVIIQGIRIAAGAMIPAGAVVTRDVPQGTRLSLTRAQ
jgi:UDP-perosamine 4-acetyltransferase